MTAQPSEKTAQAEALYAAGQLAFERGNYREAVLAFEAGVQMAGGPTFLGGMIQLWLMNAYAAAGRGDDAIALGERLTGHPSYEVRKQGKRVLEILQAPQLNRRADWLTPIPDLSNLEDSDGKFSVKQYQPPKKAQPVTANEPEPEDLSQMNTRDNGFLWAAIALILLTVAGLGLWH